MKNNVLIAQELQMSYSPILGTTYQLNEVILEEENLKVIETKDCNHTGNSLIEIDKRNLCTICGTWAKDTK